MPTRNKTPYVKAEEWCSYFSYDERVGSCLTNKLTRRKARYGCTAGYRRQDGYWVVHVNLHNYLAHRIVWELHNGKIEDGFQIDHLDGNPSNNRLENLRCICRADNQRNMKRPKNNTSGVHGVVRQTVTKRSGSVFIYWTARWREPNPLTGKKTVSVNFSVNTLGEEKAFQLAVKARRQAIHSLKKQGFGYTDRHGT